VNQGHDRADSELPLKAEGQVKHDAAQRHQHAEAALVAQLFTHLRANELDALDHRRIAGICLTQRSRYLVAQQRIIAGHTHQQVGRRTKALHHGIVEAGRNQFVTHLGQISRLLVGQLDKRTAGEVQAVVHALVEHAEQGQHGKQYSDAERYVANAHEVDCT